jgi:peptide chain release factor 1
VTVAVLPLASVTAEKTLADADIRTEWFSGTGAGGQHRNKHQNSCRLVHEPTGVMVTSQCRKRTQSYSTALDELTQRVNQISYTEQNARTSQLRSAQTGTGMRSDKTRTYRFQEDRVKDHLSGKSAKASHIMRGQFDKLWQ